MCLGKELRMRLYVSGLVEQSVIPFNQADGNIRNTPSGLRPYTSSRKNTGG